MPRLAGNRSGAIGISPRSIETAAPSLGICRPRMEQSGERLAGTAQPTLLISLATRRLEYVACTSSPAPISNGGAETRGASLTCDRGSRHESAAAAPPPCPAPSAPPASSPRRAEQESRRRAPDLRPIAPLSRSWRQE